MADLLIRNLTEQDKQALAVLAAKNNRSLQAEAYDILVRGIRSKGSDWTSRLRQAALSFGGVDLEQPERHVPRSVEIEQ